VPLATMGPQPGRRWKPSEGASILAVDTPRIGTLRVRYGDSPDRIFPPPETG